VRGGGMTGREVPCDSIHPLSPLPSSLPHGHSATPQQWLPVTLMYSVNVFAQREPPPQKIAYPFGNGSPDPEK